MPYTINILELIGTSFPTTDEEGLKVYDEIKKHDSVILDFAEMEAVSFPFAESSIGKLVYEEGIEAVQKHVRIQNMESSFNLEMNLVLGNSERLYELSQMSEEDQNRAHTGDKFYDDVNMHINENLLSIHAQKIPKDMKLRKSDIEKISGVAYRLKHPGWKEFFMLAMNAGPVEMTLYPLTDEDDHFIIGCRQKWEDYDTFRVVIRTD